MDVFDINGVLHRAAQLLPREMDGDRSRWLLHAIGLQESQLLYRYQLLTGRPGIKGPARGLWQFEVNGVAAVMRHKASRVWLRRACDEQEVAFKAPAIWTAIETDDVLACALARLLLWTDPKPLPAIGEVDAAWAYYVRTWRPGKPRREKWDANCSVAAACTY